MHELAITEHLLSQVLNHAHKHRPKKVTRINLKLGEFSGYVDESIEFYWRIIAKDTIASDARLSITRVKGQLKCATCAHLLPRGKKADLCPKCKSFKLIIVGGSELLLESIEI